MPKMVIIGAGSGFGARLSIDVLAHPELQDMEIGLCDIHAGRLEKVRAYIQRTIDHYKLPAKLRVSTNRRDLLPGADFVITSIAVGGGAYHGFPYKAEIEIPRKYGIEQSVADTVTVGGIFRFLRTGPVQHKMYKEMEELCPNALVLNHTNPMCMLIWLHSVASSMKVVGMCHGVQATMQMLAKLMEVPHEEVSFTCAGINHLAWFLDMKHKGHDLYPRLRERVRQVQENPALVEEERWFHPAFKDKVRAEILQQIGYYCTESSQHDSEYLPYFRKSPETMEMFNLKNRQVPDHQPTKRAWMEETGGGDADVKVPELKASVEYSSHVIRATITNNPFRFNGNVMNHGLIDNLPEGCCVEVPCYADAQGIQPTHVGALPAHLAALDRTNVAVQELAVQAVLNRDRDAAFYACCLDPLTSTMLRLDQIRSMFDELWEAEKDLLTWFDPSNNGELPEICAD